MPSGGSTDPWWLLAILAVSGWLNGRAIYKVARENRLIEWPVSDKERAEIDRFMEWRTFDDGTRRRS